MISGLLSYFILLLFQHGLMNIMEVKIEFISTLMKIGKVCYLQIIVVLLIQKKVKNFHLRLKLLRNMKAQENLVHCYFCHFHLNQSFLCYYFLELYLHCKAQMKMLQNSFLFIVTKLKLEMLVFQCLASGVMEKLEINEKKEKKLMPESYSLKNFNFSFYCAVYSQGSQILYLNGFEDCYYLLLNLKKEFRL